jgi:hypothetical protein
MGRPHNQAWAIAHSTADRHGVNKSLEDVMIRPDMIGPRPLQPAQQDRTMFPMREERSRFVVQEQATPMIRRGMQAGVLPGAQPPPPPQPLLMLTKSLPMPAKSSAAWLQPQPAQGVSHPTQVLALNWLRQAAGEDQ